MFCFFEQRFFIEVAIESLSSVNTALNASVSTILQSACTSASTTALLSFKNDAICVTLKQLHSKGLKFPKNLAVIFRLSTFLRHFIVTCRHATDVFSIYYCY